MLLFHVIFSAICKNAVELFRRKKRRKEAKINAGKRQVFCIVEVINRSTNMGRGDEVMCNNSAHEVNEDMEVTYVNDEQAGCFNLEEDREWELPSNTQKVLS